MMAEAFEDDPMQRWLFPDDRRRRRRLRRFYELDIRHRLNGRAHPHCAGDDGVAFWHPPVDADTVPFFAALRISPAFTSVVAHHPIRAVQVLAEIVRCRPQEPHWYLSHLAVAPGCRGRGLGRELLEIGKANARADGTGVYLETANPSNLTFYARSGFREAGVVDHAGAPPVWLLWRPAERR